MKKINALVVDPCMESQRQLIQLGSTFSELGEVVHTTTFESTREQLRNGYAPDILFISLRATEADPVQFVYEMKSTLAGRDTTYVLLLGEGKSNHQEVVAAKIAGCDAALIEPFSELTLREIISLVGKVKQERADARCDRILRHFLEVLVDQINHIAYIRKRGQDAAIGLGVLSHMTEVLNELDERLLNRYYTIALEWFPTATPRGELSTKLEYLNTKDPQVRAREVQNACERLASLTI